MVKNATGGKGGKKFARKQMFSSQSNTQIRWSENDEELYGVVIQVLGGGHCYVKTAKHDKIMCYIPNKFSGRSKRNNIIALNTVLLLGTREWEKPAKILDVLCVYDSNEVSILIKNPQFPSSLLLANKEKDDFLEETIGLFSHQSNEEIYLPPEKNLESHTLETKCTEFTEEEWDTI